MKFLYIFLFMLLSGCSVKVPPTVSYTLKDLDIKTYNKETLCKQKHLKVLDIFSSPSYLTNDMRYISDDKIEGVFHRSNWNTPIINFLYNDIVMSIRNSEIFKSVDNYSSVAKSDMKLEIELNDFNQYFYQKETKSYVVIDITLSIVDTKNSQVVSQKRFKQEVITKKPTAKSGVKAFDIALNKILNDINDWLYGVCG